MGGLIAWLLMMLISLMMMMKCDGFVLVRLLVNLIFGPRLQKRVGRKRRLGVFVNFPLT